MFMISSKDNQEWFIPANFLMTDSPGGMYRNYVKALGCRLDFLLLIYWEQISNYFHLVYSVRLSNWK